MFVSALVNLYTHDIEAGIRFYRDLIGFEETFRRPDRQPSRQIAYREAGAAPG